MSKICICGETNLDNFYKKGGKLCKECTKKKARDRYRNLSEQDKRKYVSNAYKNYKTWSKENIFQYKFLQIKARAKRKDLEINIDSNYLENLYKKQSGICPYTKVKLGSTKEKIFTNGDLHTLSVERIDSKKGYVKGNVELVSSIVNSMKNELSKSEFIKIIKLIHSNL